MTSQPAHPRHPNSPLELAPDTIRHMVDLATEKIIRYVTSLPDQPAVDLEGGAELARSLVEDLPEDGQPFEPLFDDLFARIVPKGFNTAGPGYLAYIPGGGLIHSAVADMIANAVNRYVGVWLAAPGLVQLEANVIRWFNQMVGYPLSAGGVLTSGGSIANLTATVAARTDRLSQDFTKGTVYTSDQVHHSIVKSVQLAGVPAANVRLIPVDEQFRIRVDALETQIARDRREGWQPFLLVGSAGTTNTGAVDDLDALATLAQHERIWFHVDAAYGGFFALTERGSRRFAGLERADTITLDPHKGLFLPYGTGCLLARDLEALRRAHSVTADYMPALQHSAEFVDFCEISPELSRDFRGLRVWLPLKMHGARAFRAALDEKLDLTAWAADRLRAIAPLEVVAEPQLSITAFGFRDGGGGGGGGGGIDDMNRRTRQLLERINAKRRVYVTGTLLGDRYVIRICVLSFRTHLDRMEAGLADIESAVAEMMHEPARVRGRGRGPGG